MAYTSLSRKVGWIEGSAKNSLILFIPITRVVPHFGTPDLLRSPEDMFLNAVTEHYLDEEYQSKGEAPPTL